MSHTHTHTHSHSLRHITQSNSPRHQMIRLWQPYCVCSRFSVSSVSRCCFTVFLCDMSVEWTPFMHSSVQDCTLEFVFTVSDVKFPPVACLVGWSCLSELKVKFLNKTNGTLVTEMFLMSASNKYRNLFLTCNQASLSCTATTFVL